MSARVVLDNRLRFLLDDLSEGERKLLKKAFEHPNPVYHKNAGMGFYPKKSEPPIVKTWEEEGGYLSVPRGGAKRARVAVPGAWKVDDRRSLGREDLAGRIPSYRGFELRSYQEELLDLVEERQNVLVRAATGSGKTTSALAATARLNRPTIVVVWGKALLQQWVERAGLELGISDVGIVQGKERRLRPLTVAMQQTLWARGVDRELREAFGFLIVDEVQAAAARTVRDVVDAFPAKYRLGISDDERRADGKEFLTYDAFGEVAQEVDFDSLADEGKVLDVEVRCVPTRFRPSPGYYLERDFNQLLDAMCSDEDRNAEVLAIVEEEVAKGEQVLVFSHRVEHCARIDRALVEKGIRSGLLLGGEDWAAAFERTREGLRSGKIRVGTGTIKAIGQGIDLPNVAVGVVATPIASSGGRTLFRQVRGRVCRAPEGKRDARLYVIVDPEVQCGAHVRNLAKWARRVLVRSDDGSWQEAAAWLAAHKGDWRERRERED